MATETPIDPLDSLGPQYGGINRPSIDALSLQPFEGDRLSMPEINFPPSALPTENMNRPDQAIRSVVGTRPNPPGKVTKDTYVPGALAKKANAIVIANQDKNEYSRVYSYDAGPSGNAFYKRYAAYGQEKFDKIGFSPLRDNEALFNSQTTKMDDFTRMMTNSFVPLFTRGFVSGPKSLVKMLHGDFSADLEDARIYEEAAAIGQSTKGGIGGFLSNTAMNFAYTAGIISEAVLEEVAAGLITAGTGGAGAGVLFASTANSFKNILRGVKGLDLAMDGSRAVGNTLRALTNSNNARKVWSTLAKGADTKLARFLNPLENLTDAGKAIYKNSDNLAGLARVSSGIHKTFGGFYRDVRAINMALSEARLEGGFVQNTVYDKLYGSFYDTNGRAPSDKEQKELLNTAQSAGMKTLYWNTALIFATNKIVLPNIVGPRASFANSLKNKIEDVVTMKGGKVVFEKTIQAGKKLAKGEFKFVENSFKQTLKEIKAAPFRKGITGVGGYFKANLMEGLQENAQEVIAGAMEKYYTHNYFKEHSVAAHQYNKGLSSYLMDEAGGQISGRGFETFASGFFMGIFAGGLNKSVGALQWGYNHTFNKEETAKYKELRANYGNRIAQQLTDLYNNPQELFNSRFMNQGVQNTVAANKEDMTAKEQQDAMDEAFITQMSTAIENNSLDHFTDYLASMKELSVEEFEDTFGFEKGTGAKQQAKIDNLITRAKEIETTYKRINDNFPSPIDLSKIDKTHPDYEAAALFNSAWESAKRQAVFANESFKAVTGRMAKIYDTILSEPSLQKLKNNDVQVLFKPARMNNEIGILKTEVEALENATDPQLIKDREFKKKKIAALENFMNKYSEYDSYHKRNNNRGIAREDIAKEKGVELSDVTEEEIDALLDEMVGAQTEDNTIKVQSGLETAYKDYLKLLAEREDTYVFDRDIDVSFEKLRNFYELDNESKVFADHTNILSDPKGFFDLVQRNNEWMTKIYKNRKEYFDNMVQEQLKAKEGNDLLNFLANQNIYVDLDQFEKFLNEGVLPTEFYDGETKVINANNPRYFDIIRVFNQLADFQQAKNDLGIDADVEKEVKDLQKKMQDEIDALDKVEGRVNIAGITVPDGKSVMLKDVVKEVQSGEYVELGFADGQTITFYNDNGVIKFDNAEGEEVKVKRDTTEYTSGVRFKFDMIPDPAKVAEIQERYQKLISEVYERAVARKQSQTGANAYEAITQETPLDQIEAKAPELYADLKRAFNEYMMDTMPEEITDGMSDDQMMNLFAEFVASNPEASTLIADYNVKARTKAAADLLGEQEEFDFFYNNQTLNTGTLTIPQLRTYIRSFQDIIDKFEKKASLTQEEKDKLNKGKILINKFEALIRTRGMAGLSPELKKAKAMLDQLILAQDGVVLDEERHVYIIDGEEYTSVTTAIAALKARPYSYANEKELTSLFYNYFGKAQLDANGKEITDYDVKLENFIKALKKANLQGFSSFTYKELEKELASFDYQNDEASYDALMKLTLNTVREKTFESSRIAGNYVDAQIKNLFENKEVQFDADSITREAFDNLFSTEIDPRTNLPKGSLAQIKARVDSGELIILSRGLRVYDKELKIAGEIDLLVADQNNNIFIIDVKTGSKSKWDGWVGGSTYAKRKNSTDPKEQNKAKYAEDKLEDYELQQTAYANMLYRMLGIEANIGILPVQVELNNETGKIMKASKPTTDAIKPSQFTIGLSKAKVQERVDSLIPKVFINEAGEEVLPGQQPKGFNVGKALSAATKARFRALGITDAMATLMTDAEIEEAKTFTEKSQAKALIAKYANLAMNPVVADDVESTVNPELRSKNAEILRKRIEILNRRKDMIAEDIYVVNNTLAFLDEILNSSAELSRGAVDEVLNKINDLEKIINSNSKKNTKRGKSTAALISSLKQQIKQEFRVSNDILNRMRELQYEVQQLEAIKADLTNQVNFYNNLLADPRQTELGAPDIKNRIEKIQRKIGTIEKLIDALKTAISKSLAYLKEYIKIWRGVDTKYQKFQNETGYQPLSRDQISDLIKSTDPLDQEQLALYPQLSIEFKALQDEVLEAMDNVELMENVKDEESKRVDQLNKALNKYNDQIRYLQDLLVPMSQELFGDNLSAQASGGPMPTATVESMNNTEERVDDATEDLDEELIVYSSLSFEVVPEVSMSEVKKNIDALGLDDLYAYRTELRSLYQVGKITLEDGAIINEWFKAKEAALQTPQTMATSPLSLAKGSEVIANFDIFKDSNLFAPQGSTLTVTMVDNSKKMITLKYNNKSIDVSFDDIENNFSTMNGLVNQTPDNNTSAPLDPEDSSKVAMSTDGVDSFMQDKTAIDKAVGEADVKNLDDLEDNLLNNLEC